MQRDLDFQSPRSKAPPSLTAAKPGRTGDAKPMKLPTTTAFAIIAAAVASPVVGQGYGSSRAAQMQQQPQQMSSAPGSQAQTAPAASANKLATVRPSKNALKPIVDLQTAVNKNDVATIPAKIAAAQAVATTKEDHYVIGQLQLKAALAANDNGATA